MYRRNVNSFVTLKIRWIEHYTSWCYFPLINSCTCPVPPPSSSRYGVGYHMTMVKEQNCDSLAVSSLVTQVITGAEQVTDVGAELSFILPSQSIHQFPQLFDILESQLTSYCTEV